MENGWESAQIRVFYAEQEHFRQNFFLSIFIGTFVGCLAWGLCRCLPLWEGEESPSNTEHRAF